MVLTDEDIKKFQTIYKKEFGIEINRETAYEKAVKLLSLMSAVYKPMTQKEHGGVQAHRKATADLLSNKINDTSPGFLEKHRQR